MPPRSHGDVDERLDVLLLRDIGHNCNGLSALSHQALGHELRPLGVNVGHNDLCALAGEDLANALADIASSNCDDRHFVLQSHETFAFLPQLSVYG
jgi:hypothetical protein